MKRALIYSSLFVSSLAFAAPQGGTVVAGSAVISQSGDTTTIDQASLSTVINWHSFDTANNETVNFNQPNANSTVLNRINSGIPTNFAGSLNANGRVFIVNSAGMVFAKGSSISAASVIATTADIKNADFIGGNYKFFSQPGSENSSIINNGEINAHDSGPRTRAFIALIAPNVINGDTGLIGTFYGNIVLASGKTFVLDFNQDGLINFDASSIIKNGYIENAGEIYAYHGKVYMTTNTASKVLDNVVNVSGITEANVVIKRPGKNNNDAIILGSTDPKAGTITTGFIWAGNIILKADRGIAINGNIHVKVDYRDNPATVTATTTTGNIAINSIIDADGISLSAENGAITESNSSAILANNLNTLSSFGTTLSGAKNKIWNFTASNTTRGGIYLKNYGEPRTSLGETGGGYKLDTVGFWEYYFGDNS